MNDHNNFLQAISVKKYVQVKFNSQGKGIIQRLCVPFDFGPWRRKINPNPDRYHFYDLDSPDGKHNLSILPEQIISIDVTEQSFDPAVYIKWNPNWFIKRDWGIYS